MDHFGELLTLGLDAIVFSICSRLYFKYTYTINVVERAQRLGINPDVGNLSDKSKGYVIVQGTVRAIDKPIRSLNARDVTGVIQKLTIKEHAVARSASGFWSDQKNIIQEAFNVVPFLLKKGKYEIEIIDPLSADILDLDTIHDKFESKSLSVLDHIVGFFNGVRQRGIETTEELLKEGSVVTGIGEIVDVDERLQLVPPTSGDPYFLVTMPVSSLLRKLEEHRVTFKWLTLLFGSVGVVLCGLVVRRWWRQRKIKLQEEEIKRRLEETRKERRRNARCNEDLTENERCVVCHYNPKEIIFLPCGHVSLCEDCSEQISSECPVCRSIVVTKAAAFIA